MNPELARWTGDEWRWYPANHPAAAVPSIQVIERAEPRPESSEAKTVPFGFSRALDQRKPKPKRKKKPKGDL